MPGKITIIKEASLHSGKSFELLENILYGVVGIHPDNVTMLSLPLNIDAFKASQPDVIISIGEAALNYMCNLKGIIKFAGTTQKAMEIPLIPVASPGYIEHNPNYLRKFAEDINTAYQISMGIDKVEVSNQWVLVKDLDTIRKVVQYCKKTGICCHDFETTELTDKGTFDENFVATTLSISFQQGSSYVIPLYHPESSFLNNISEVVAILQDIWSDPNILKIGQNIKFDCHVASWLGLHSFRGPFHDTMLLHQLIDETLTHNLKDMVREYYPKFSNYEAALAKNWAAPLMDLARYNALDSDLTLRLYFIFVDILLKDPAIYLEYRNLTAPATKTLFFAEEAGMLCDKAHLTKSIREVDVFIAEQEDLMSAHVEVKRFNHFKKNVRREIVIRELETKLEKEKVAEYKSKSAQENQVKRISEYTQKIENLKTGVSDTDNVPINFASPDQLSELLFSKEGFGFVIPKQEYSKWGEKSTNADNISLIKDKTGFIEQLQAYRQLKLINATYLKSILEKLDGDHYVHATYNQNGTKTGRLCIEENQLVQIPGGSKPIKDIKTGDLVYCYDDKGKLRIRKVLNTWDKGIHPIVKLIWQSSGHHTNDTDHGELLCTPDHFIKTFKGWIKAKDLKNNDRLFHVARRDHYENNSSRPRLYFSIGGMKKEQIVIKQELFNCSDSKIAIHHKDLDSSNNYPDNLELMNRKEHTSLHYKLLFAAGRIKWEHLKDHRPIRKSGEENPLYIHKTKYQLLRMLYEAGGRPTYVAMDFTAYKEKCILYGIDIAEVSKRFNREGLYISRGLLKHSFEYETHKKLKLGYYRVKELYEYYSMTNHRVKGVIPCGQARVYDIEVEEFNNFIASEICVHNSAKNPNLQNIITRTKFPIVEEAVKFVKKAFIPPSGCTLVAYDYSQIELRVVTHYAQEKTMLQIYKEDKDIHEMTASNSRGYTIEEFQKLKETDAKAYKQMRYEAKAENFGFVYGISPAGFKEFCRTDYGVIISLKEAERRREAYYKKYPGLLEYHKLYIGKARKFGYVRTFFGRKIHLPDINSINGGVRGHAERNAINGPIQGSAGEMTIFAMSVLFNRLSPRILIVNDIHDAIYFYIPDELMAEACPVIKKTMENLPLKLYFGKEIDSVPIKADMETSKKSWGDMKA
jgi:DNA polymerase-1